MATQGTLENFRVAAMSAGATTVALSTPADIAAYIHRHSSGDILLPPCVSSSRLQLAAELRAQGATVVTAISQETAEAAAVGVTGVNFAIAATGTLVIDSTPEALRLASTLPEKHFALLDPRNIVADDRAAVALMQRFHQQQPRNYLAWITGPSRTADIERVLTIGVHGPRELHILLIENLADDPLEA